MSNSRTAAYVDYQQRAQEFTVGDLAYPFMSGDAHNSGRVVAVWPAIGMVDIEWPHGTERYPVEELQRYEQKDFLPPEPEHNNVPGGAETVSVPGGPPEDLPGDTQKMATRVARAWVKKSLYWASRDRQYKARKDEIESGRYACPKCKEHHLRPAVYKRRDGTSEPLLGCPNCLFLIKKIDIIGHPEYDDGSADKKPFSRLRIV